MIGSVRKLKKGDPEAPWVYEYTDPTTGQRKRVTPKSGRKKDAEAIQRKIVLEIGNGEHAPNAATRTMGEICETYLRYCEDLQREGAIGKGRYANLKTAFVQNIIPNIGRLKVIDLTASSIDEMYRSLTRERGLAPITAKQRVIMLRQMEKFAVRRGLMKRTPVKDALSDFKGGNARPVRTFSQEEAKRMLQAAQSTRRGCTDRHGALLECFVNFGAFCGLRYGEITGLKIGNLDLDARTVRVRNSYSPHDGLKGPKSKAGVRDVPVPPHIVMLARRWVEEHRTENALDLVFTTTTGAPLKSAHFHEDMWQPLLLRAGLPERDAEDRRFHFHALRHFAASLWIANGVDLPTVAKLLGHSKFDMTLQVYTHAIVEAQMTHAALDRIALDLVSAPVTLTIEATEMLSTPVVSGKVLRRREERSRNAVATETRLPQLSH